MSLWRLFSVLIGGSILVGLLGLYGFAIVVRTNQGVENLAQEQTALFYEISPGQRLVIEVEPGDRLFKIVSLLAESSTTQRLEDTPEYRLVFEFFDPQGKRVRVAQFSERTLSPEVLETERGQTPSRTEDGRRLCALRATYLWVGNDLPKGGQVVLSATDLKTSLLVRIYKFAEVSEVERLALARSALSELGERLAKRMGFTTMGELPEPIRERLFSNKWIRSDAKPESGGALHMTRVYYVEEEEATEIDETLLRIEPGFAVVFNVQALPHAQIEIEPLGLAENLQVCLLHARGDLYPERRCSNHTVTTLRTIQIQLLQGVQSVSIENKSGENPILLRAVAERNTVQPVGFTRAVAFDPARPDKEALIPERTFLRSFWVDDGASVEFSVLGAQPSEPFKFVVRLPVNPDATHATAQLTVSILDAKTHEIARRTINIELPRSPFEELIYNTSHLPISEPQQFFVGLPPRAAIIRVQATGNSMLVSGYQLLRALPQGKPLYPQELKLRRWIYEKTPRPNWQRVLPINWRKLCASGKEATIIAQTRLETLKRTEQVSELQWQSCTATEPHVYSILLSPIEQPDKLSPRASIWCNCRNANSLTFEVPSDPVDPLALLVEVEILIPNPCPQTASIFLNTEEIRFTAPCERTFKLRKRLYAQNPVKLTWKNDFQIFVKVASADGCPAQCQPLKALVVYQLSPKERIDYAIETQGAETGLNVSVFALNGQACLKALVDHGLPKRKRILFWSGFTLPERFFCPVEKTADDAAVLKLQTSYQSATRFKTLFIPLRADLEDGVHTVSIINAGNQTVFVRAFTTGKCLPGAKATQVLKVVE